MERAELLMKRGKAGSSHQELNRPGRAEGGAGEREKGGRGGKVCLPPCSPAALPLLIACCLVGVIHISRPLAQSLEVYIGKPIAQLRLVFEGFPDQELREEVSSRLLVREGMAYSVAEIRRSLLALYESGRVSNARVETQLNGDGTLSVTFVVTPQVRIAGVEFEGLVEVSAEELQARLPELERGSKYSEASLRRGAEQIYEALRDRGYYQVSVSYRTDYDETRTNATITYEIDAGEPATTGTVTLTGSSRFPESRLRLEMKTQPGVRFSLAQLKEDLQRLLALHVSAGYLDARIGPPDLSYDNAANAVKISLPVNSGPKFTVKVAGYEIKEKKLRQLLPMLREGGVNAATLDESARRLRDHLQEEGYFFAEVEPPPLPDFSAESQELLFKVTPQQRYRLTEIRIEGSRKVTFLDLADSLRSKTESFFPLPLFSRYTRGITSEQALQSDAEVILSRLRDLGFRRARLLSIRRAVNLENDRLTIIFNVEEGPRSFIGEIAFKGNTLYTAETLRQLIDLRPGDPFSPSRIKAEANKILKLYYDQGYALASVQTRQFELGKERLRVLFEISEGPLVYINRVLINNLGARKRTKPERVRPFLRFKAGDKLLQDELARSEQHLYELGAFRRISVRSEPLGPEGTTGQIRRNLLVELEEDKSRIFVYGAGYQSDEGARGIIEVSDPNIFGRLSTASLRLRASPRSLLGQLSYADPRPFGYQAPALFSLLLQRERRPAFDSRRATVLMQVERRLDERALLLFRYNYEDVRVTNPASITDRRDQPVRLSRLSASYAFDGRDNPFDARQGRYHSADFSFAIRALGGNEQFLRFFTENQFYHTLPRSGGTVLAGNIRVGLARNIGVRADLPPDISEPERALLPITERFFSGGSTTLRGYDFEQAGPRDARNRPLGGNALMVINAELRRSLYRQIGVVGFYDGGNVFRTISDLSFKNFTHTIGAGLRFNTPLGPLRVDVGYLVSDPFRGSGLPPDVARNLKLSRLQVHLSFGQAF